MISFLICFFLIYTNVLFLLTFSIYFLLFFQPHHPLFNISTHILVSLTHFSILYLLFLFFSKVKWLTILKRNEENKKLVRMLVFSPKLKIVSLNQYLAYIGNSIQTTIPRLFEFGVWVWSVSNLDQHIFH